MKRSQGLALIVVLLFLQVLSILGLYAMQMAWIQMKRSQFGWRQLTMENATEEALHMTERQVQSTLPACIIPMTPTETLLHYPNSWWQSKACHGNAVGKSKNFQYYYIVELLGADPCAYIQIQPTFLYANYIRLTVLGINEDIKMILQSTLTNVNQSSTAVCKDKGHYVNLGRQMWRWLIVG